MLKEPQTSTNFLKRSNEFTFPSPLLASPHQSQGKYKTKLINRRQSITRNTASSLAKIVRPNSNEKQNTTVILPDSATVVNQRQQSSTMKTRKQSLNVIIPIDSKPLTMMDHVGTTDKIQKRRQSWSPVKAGASSSPNPVQVINETAPGNPSSNSPIPERKVLLTLKKDSDANSTISFASNNTCDNLSIKDLSKNTPKKPTSKTSFTEDITNMKHASSSSSSSTLTISSSRYSYKQTSKTSSRNNPITNNIKKNSITEHAGKNQSLNSLETPSASLSPTPDNTFYNPSSQGCTYFEYNKYISDDNEQLPGYMRRPICVACNRNVKVTSISENTAHSHYNTMNNRFSSTMSLKNNNSNSSSSSSSSNKRKSSSISATTVTKNHDHFSNDMNPLKFCIPNNNKYNIVTKKTKSSETITERNSNVPIDHSDSTTQMIEATSTVCLDTSMSSQQSDKSIPNNKKDEYSRYPSSSNDHQKINFRADCPTSPIPTATQRRTNDVTLQRTNFICSSHLDSQPQTSSRQQLKNRISDPSLLHLPITTIKKWATLLSQQQQQLLFILMQNGKNDEDLKLIRNNIKVVTNQEQFETALFETQLEILQKFTTMLQQRKKETLFSSPITTIYNNNNNNNNSHGLLSTKNDIREENEAVFRSLMKPTSWQTKLEYGAVRLKWNVNRWIGNLIVGTGDIEAHEYDPLGYPKDVIISGICVTTELELLPKSFQKYYKPNHDGSREIICHKYIIRLNREKRLTTFQLLEKGKWAKDTSVTKCEFSMKDKNEKTKQCHVKFGLFTRRHHCRSCGHIFCHTHSSNLLPLFASNGEERGEWSRVCDLCFFNRIDAQSLTRS